MTPTLALDDNVERVRLVSPKRAQALAKMGIKTVRDLLCNFPRRYIDLSSKELVAQARIGDTCTIEGCVHEIKLKKPNPRLNLVEISLLDQSGLMIVTCFRQPWLMDKIQAGTRIAVAGKVEFNYGFKRMTNPFIEVLDEGEIVEGMVIPVHPACEAISPAWMRNLERNALNLVDGASDFLPLELRIKYRLPSYQSALRAVHFPRSIEEAHAARRRLAYDEIFLLQLALQSQEKERSAGKSATRHVVDGISVAALSAILPFDLTDDQQSALRDIFFEMTADHAMNHMLLGDVGTGKTVVAAFALAACADSGKQALLMAPTEVLAAQHAKSMGGWFDEIGISWALLCGSTSQEERSRILDGLADGSISICIGTHALIEDGVQLKDLSLAVIDEQQRFGVEQRAALLAKGSNPDALYLTATPIPRTLALALYGSLTFSYLHARPISAAPRETKVLSKSQIGQAYDVAREALSRGEQVFVVCPLVGQSAQAKSLKSKKTDESQEEEYVYASVSLESDEDFVGDNTTAAIQEAKFLQEQVFQDFNVGLLYGAMPAVEKNQTMADFAEGKIDVLVSTTVIEVGIDIPRASVMVVQDADHFGLSQLHQLRGRVGRHGLASQVFLVSASKQEKALSRLYAMEKTDDGFELANYDLSLRREGDILGNRQHGASTLKLVNVVRDAKMIEAAYADACALLELDPELSSENNRALGREMRRIFADETLAIGG